MNRLAIFLAVFLFGVAGSTAQQEPYVQPLNSTEIFKTAVFRLAVGSSGQLIAVTPVDRQIKLLDAATLTDKTALPPVTVRTSALGFSPSGGILATGGVDGKITVWNTGTGLSTRQISAHSSGVVAIVVPNENLVVSAEMDRTIKISDMTSGKTLGSSTGQEELTSLAVHPGGSMFAVGTVTGTVRIHAVAQLAQMKLLTDSKERVTVLAFSPDGKVLVAGCSDGTVYFWDATSFALKTKLPVHAAGVVSLAIDPQIRWVLTSSSDNTLKITDIASGQVVKSLQDTGGYVSAIVFLNDETFLTGTSKGAMKRFTILPSPPDATPPVVVFNDPPPGTVPRVLAREYSLSGIVYDDKALGTASLNGASMTLMPLSADEAAKIPAGMDGKKFKFTLPLDSVGPNTYELLANDKAGHSTPSYGKVVRLSTEQAVEITMPVNDQEIDSVSLPIRFRSWFEVSSYSVSVNLVEIIAGGIPNTRVVGDVIIDEVPLVVGYNQIQIAINGRNGERFSRTIGVTRKAAEVTLAQPVISAKKRDNIAGPQKWAVVVGVSEYKNPGIPSLKFANKDAESFANFLRRPEGGGYDTEHMKVLLDKDATLANVKEALINFLNQAIDMDLVVIYFAGHGAPEPARQQNLYLLTHDTDPNSLGTTAFPMWDIQTVLARYINAKRVVVFTDACHSGGISVNYATRGLGVTEQNMINQYLTDLANTKEGTVVFTASAAGETSQEFPELAHGAFTYYLLEGMGGKADYNNDYTITINEAMQYTEEMVKRKTRGAQNPTRSQTNYDKELTISLVPH